MSNVKRLLKRATPLPWESHPVDGEGAYIYSPNGRYDVPWAGDSPVKVAWLPHAPASERPVRDAALIVHAVNHLPDYEAAVDALEILTAESEWLRDYPDASRRHPDGRTIAGARAALCRLRGGE